MNVMIGEYSFYYEYFYLFVSVLVILHYCNF